MGELASAGVGVGELAGAGAGVGELAGAGVGETPAAPRQCEKE